MPTNNYFNPNAAQPQLPEYVSAFFAPEQMNQYRQAMALQSQMAQQSIDRNDMENQAYRLDTPTRERERVAKQSGFSLEDLLHRAAIDEPGYGQARARGTMGQDMSHYAKGQFDTQTLPGKVDAENTGNLNKVFENVAHNLEVAHSMSPMLSQQQYQQLLQTVPQSIRGQFPQVYSPEVPDMIRKMGQQVVQSPKHRGEMEKQAAINASHEKVGAGNNAATIQAAQLRANARIKTLMEQFEGAKTPEQAIMYGEALIMDENLPDPAKAQIRTMVERAYKLQSEKMARGSFNFNNPGAGVGPIAQQINERLSEGAPSQQQPGQGTLGGQGQQQQYVPGQVYRGRTGAYRYTGPARPTPQDLQSPRNWQKVQ